MYRRLFCFVVPIRGRDDRVQIPDSVGHLFFFFGPRRRLAMPLTAKGAESSPLFLCTIVNGRVRELQDHRKKIIICPFIE